jgi:hypothetical protein
MIEVGPDQVDELMYIRQTLYILAKNMVDAINKEADREDKLKLDLMISFQ